MTIDGAHAMGQTFKSMEHQGWNERASAYDAHTARFTSYGVDPLHPLRRETRCACRCPRSWSEASSALTRGEMHVAEGRAP